MNKSFMKRAILIALVVIFTASIGIPAIADSTMYKKGDSGKEIAELQKMLKKQGFFNEDCTGYFGDVTEKAVKAFQKKHGLSADGILGSGTISLLKKLSASKTTASRSSSSRRVTTVTYTVKSGDTIWDIADEFNVSVDAILKANNLTENSLLQIGDKLVIPGVTQVLKTTAPTTQAKTTTTTTNDKDAEIDDSVYVVKEGDTLSSIAEDYGVTVNALLKANNLSEDTVIQIGQELKIPENDGKADSSSTSSDKDSKDSSVKKGEYLGWFDTVQYIYKNGDIATVTDLKTGKSFKVKRLYGKNHADSEPLTAEDTATMKSIYGSWSWDRRAIVVTIDGRNIAASMNGMPHGGESIKDNNFGGHFCIHFKDSKTHKGNKPDAGHQAAVKQAAGL